MRQLSSRLPMARRATPARPAAFPFSYMDPSKYVDVIDGYNVRNVSIRRFAPIGAPLLPVTMSTCAARWSALLGPGPTRNERRKQNKCSPCEMP